MTFSQVYGSVISAHSRPTEEASGAGSTWRRTCFGRPTSIR